MKAKFTISKGFKQFLEEKKLGPTELEKMTGYSKQQISQTLNGEIEPTRQMMRKLCEVFRWDAETILETTFSEPEKK